MEIVMAVIIGIIAVAFFIMINLRNNRKMDEFDDFSKEKEDKKNKKREFNNSENLKVGKNEIDLEYSGKNNYKADNRKINNENLQIKEIDSESELERENILQNYGEYEEIVKSAEFNIRRGLFKKAKEMLEIAAKLDKNGYYELGKYYYYCEKDKQKALNALNIACDAGIAETFYYKGLIEEDAGNDENAMECYLKGAEKNNVGSIIKVARIAEEKKDYKQAENMYLKITDKKHAEAIYNLIRACLKTLKSVIFLMIIK